MALPDTLLCFKPKPGLVIPLNIAIHHAYLSPNQKEAPHLDFEMHALADTGGSHLAGFFGSMKIFLT